MACRAKITPVYAVLGMEIVDGEVKEEKNEEKRDVELLSVPSGHRILCANNIREKKGESQRLGAGHYFTQ